MLFTSESVGATLGVGVGEVEGAAVGTTVVRYGGKTGVSRDELGPKISCSATNGPLPEAASADMATRLSLEIANGPTAAGKSTSVGVLAGLGVTKLPERSIVCTTAMP
jgi:hypothetical protein